jgi:hypothetical protein
MGALSFAGAAGVRSTRRLQQLRVWIPLRLPRSRRLRLFLPLGIPRLPHIPSLKRACAMAGFGFA